MTEVLPEVIDPVSTVTDGFGRRSNGIDSDTGDEVELLEFSPVIVEHSGFVTALAERVARFAAVRHASYVHLRRLDRPSPDRLLLMSDRMPGWRLSQMLDESAAAGLTIDITIVIGLLRQLLPAVALFGRHNREAAIGTLSPHRLIVTPQSRLVIAEHAFGPAIEKLNLGRDRLWREFRVIMPPSAGLPRANQRADANAIGIIALSLLLGRVLETDEYPGRLQQLVENALEHRDGDGTPLSATFTTWLMRTLQFDVRTSFQSPSEAQLAFESVLASDRSYVTMSKALDRWVARIGRTIDDKFRPPEPPKVEALPPPPEPKPEPVQREAEPEPEPEPATPDWAPKPVFGFEPEPAPPRQPGPGPSSFARDDSGELRRDGADVSAEAPAEAEAAPGRGGEEPVQDETEDAAVAAEPEEVAEPAPVFEAPAAVGAPVASASARESASEPEAPVASRHPLMYSLVGVVVLLLAAVGWLATRDIGGMRGGEGELVVTSRPEGARVTIDGEQKGVTPLTVRLSSGAHVLEVQSGKSEPRVIPLTIQAGVQTAQYVELQGVALTGALEIRSEPPGARITIDGQVRGTAPMTVSNLSPGDHTVVLEAGGRKATEAVRIEAGITARLVVPMRR